MRPPPRVAPASLIKGIMEKREVWVKEPIAMYEGDATLPPRGDEGTHSGARDFRMMVGHGGGSESERVERMR